MRSYLQIFGTAALVATVHTVSAQQSNFDLSSEGWTGTGFTGSYTLPATGSSNVDYGSEFGFSGNGIRLIDIFPETFFSAPAKFLGDHSGGIGSNLTYSSFVTTTDSTAYPSVIIAGAGTGLWYANGFLPIGSWQQVSVNLISNPNWHYGRVNGPQPTSEQFRQVMSSVTGLYIIAEWRTGPDDTRLDNVNFPGSIGSRIILRDWAGPGIKNSCELNFKVAGVSVATRTVLLNQDGSFTLTNLPATGTYDIFVKASHWLRKKNPGIAVTPGGSLILNSGLNGDIDGDDSVSILDYSVLSDYFDSGSSAGDWLIVGANGFRPVDADLDGDESVNILDYSILSDSYDQSGDQ